MDDDHIYQYQMEAPVEAPPQRVVSLVPSMTETLFDLSLGSRVIAVTDFCNRPAGAVAALPKIGGTKNPNVEQIVALGPDLVIANAEENRREDIVALQAANVPVWVTFPKTVRDTFNLLWTTMHVFDDGVMIERVRAIEWACDWLERMAEARETVCSVFVPIWSDPLMTFNANTYAHDLLRVCGGVNVFAERERLYPLKADLGEASAYAKDDPRVANRDTRYPRVTLDEVVAAQPDVVLLPDEPFVFDESHRAIFAALDIPAAKNGQIHLIDGSLLFWHGTRIGHAFNTLPALMCPQEEV